MKAMVLAAGVGSRLKPITNDCPKALVEVGGVPILEIVLKRLLKAGVDAVVVNVHHLPEKIADFLRLKRNFGIRIELSREAELLDTGGGLKKVASFFSSDEPFFLHNVDILTDLDLGLMYRSHVQNPSLATLAVRKRQTNRYLLFDGAGVLRGWQSLQEGRVEWAAGPAQAEPLAFDGVHVISPAIFPKLTETGAFSMTSAYLRLAGCGEKIRAFRADQYSWETIGDLRRLQEARKRTQARRPSP